MFFFWDTPETDEAKTFADRLDQAWRTSTLTPEKIHGRNVWIAERLREMGTPVAPESVRKWFAGATHPRGETLANVAEIIGVSREWLETGNMPGAQTKTDHPSFAGYEDAFEDDEARLFDMEAVASTLEYTDRQREAERQNAMLTAAYLSARLRFAGMNTRHQDDRVLIEGATKARELAVSLLNKAANKGGAWVARLPEQISAFPPLTGPFDILIFVMPRGGREPALFPVLNRAAARLGSAGALIQMAEEPDEDGPVLELETRKGTRVIIRPMTDLAALERLAS